MPSPIAHVAIGALIYKVSQRCRHSQHVDRMPGPISILFFSLLPDLDVIPGIMTGDLNRFHNNLSHSLFAGVLIALFIAGVVWRFGDGGSKQWFVIALAAYNMHVLMDYFTVGRGVMILWPFFGERYEPAIKLFYGLHRSHGWFAIQHLWTLITEGLFVLVVVIVWLLSNQILPARMVKMNRWGENG